MRNLKTIKSQDIAILLQIASLKDKPWNMRQVASTMHVSLGEVSYSLSRCIFAGLLSDDKVHIMKSALIDFLQYGIRYTFPERPGALVRGVPTSHSAPPLSLMIRSNEAYVWPYAKGNVRGEAIQPLYPNAIEACLQDQNLYEMLALVDALRVGKIREKELAIQEIKKRI